MPVLWLWRYVFGHLVVRVRGPAVEKFINLAATRGVAFWDLRWRDGTLVGCMALPHFPAVRAIARRARCRVRIEARRGLPFLLRRLRRDPLLPAGALFFLLALVALAAPVWFIEVEGTATLPPEAIRALAGELGLRPGVLRAGVDPDAIEKGLLARLPQLAWAGVEVHGTLALIRIAEKTVPPAAHADRSPADLVADRSGVIESVVTLMGEPRVLVGQRVAPGDILIAGRVGVDAWNPAGGGPVRVEQEVRARGIVRARVWRDGYAEVPLTVHREQLTGRQDTSVLLRVGRGEIILRRRRASFARERPHVFGWTLRLGRRGRPLIEVVTTRYFELAVDTEELSPEQARAEAERLARAIALVALPEGAEVVDERVELREGAGGVAAHVAVQAIEPIGVAAGGR